MRHPFELQTPNLEAVNLKNDVLTQAGATVEGI